MSSLSLMAMVCLCLSPYNIQVRATFGKIDLEDLNLPEILSFAYKYYIGLRYIYCGNHFLLIRSMFINLDGQSRARTRRSLRRVKNSLNVWTIR